MTTQQLRLKTYTLEWTILSLLGAVLAIAFYIRSLNIHAPVSASTQEVTPVKRSQNWFFIVKVPEATMGAWGDATAAEKFESWLTTLLKKGYHPMLLSHALADLRAGRPLPTQAIVLSFSPGYRQTYELLSPILAKYSVPALWLTSRGALRRSDLRYLSYHRIRQMNRSKLWDIAYQDAVGKFVLEKSVWSFREGNSALNTNIGGATLSRLSANVNWSDKELMDRLDVERPVEKPVYLTRSRIGDRDWGIALPRDGSSGHSMTFDLVADPLKRSSGLSWFSTVGHNNMRIHLRATSIEGEFWLFLRSVHGVGKSVCVGFADNVCVIKENADGASRPLVSTTWINTPGTPLFATITLQGPKISVALNDGRYLETDALSESFPSDGIVELLAYDKVRGVAQVRGIEMEMTPL